MLKKLIFKVICAGFVLFGLSTYAGYLTTGQLPPFITKLRNAAASAPGGSSAAPGWSDIGALNKKSADSKDGYQVLQGGRTTIYKWQDAQGHWQYGERAPLNHTSTKMEVVTQASSAAATPSTANAAAQSEPAKDTAPVLVNPYSADGVQQIIEKAKEARQLMEKHNRQQEQM